MPSHPLRYLHLGNAILTRLAGETIPPLVKPALADFRHIHASYVKAHATVDATHAARDAAFDVLMEADDRQDKTVGIVADKVVGEGLTKRKSPFKGLSPLSPSELVALGYEAEAKAARALVKKLEKKSPKKGPLAIALKQLDKNAVEVETALAALAKPEAAYHRAIKARDGLLVKWIDALGRLRRRVQVAWEKEPEVAQAFFEMPTGATAAVATSKTKKAKAKKKAKKESEKAAKLAAAEAKAAAKASAKAAAKASAKATEEAAVSTTKKKKVG